MIDLTHDEFMAARAKLLRECSLTDFVPAVTPSYQRPVHQRTFLGLIRRAHLAALGQAPPLFALISEPPQVGKTESIQHGVAWWLARTPSDFLAYVSYGQDIATTKSRRTRDYAIDAGVRLRGDSRGVETWHTVEGGGLMARGLGGPVTGQSALACIFLDDPYKNRAEAESVANRDRVDEDFKATLYTRRHPRTSIIVSHTRWHEDDQIGRLMRRDREAGRSTWEHYNIRAVDDGVPFWPESGRDLAFYQQVREQVGEYTWWSLYQGEPRPRDTKLFAGAHLYDDRPNTYRVAIGIDLAYSEKTTSDWSVAVVLARTDHRCYVLHVERAQTNAPAFAATLRGLRERFGHAPVHWYASGTESGVAQLLAKEGVPVKVTPALTDKFVRAQKTSAAWNRGDVMVPRDGPSWVGPFCDECLDFSGVRDRHDDQVDALVAAYDALDAGAGGPVFVRPAGDVAPPPVQTPWGASGGGWNPWGGGTP